MSNLGVIKGERVFGWYGEFYEERLKEEIMPKLHEKVQLGAYAYPFLITSYSLVDATEIYIKDDTKPVRKQDVKVRPRTRTNGQQDRAIIFSKTQHRMLETST